MSLNSSPATSPGNASTRTQYIDPRRRDNYTPTGHISTPWKSIAQAVASTTSIDFVPAITAAVTGPKAYLSFPFTIFRLQHGYNPVVEIDNSVLFVGDSVDFTVIEKATVKSHTICQFENVQILDLVVEADSFISLKNCRVGDLTVNTAPMLLNIENCLITGDAAICLRILLDRLL